MREDRRLLRTAAADPRQTTVLRFYSWSAPTVSLGRNQTPESAVDQEACGRLGIEIVRRPTGGRAVFHGNEVTYAVISNDPRFFPLNSLGRTYALVADALQAGLAILGIETRLERRSLSPNPRPSGGTMRVKPCFVAPTRYELLVQGRKIVGSAQRRLKGAFLQHGSIPLDADYRAMSQTLGIAEGILKENLISISEAADRPVSRSELRDALLEGFRRRFDLPSLALKA